VRVHVRVRDIAGRAEVEDPGVVGGL
jgi:hypothetical protein